MTLLKTCSQPPSNDSMGSVDEVCFLIIISEASSRSGSSSYFILQMHKRFSCLEDSLNFPKVVCIFLKLATFSILKIFISQSQILLFKIGCIQKTRQPSLIKLLKGLCFQETRACRSILILLCNAIWCLFSRHGMIQKIMEYALLPKLRVPLAEPQIKQSSIGILAFSRVFRW